MKITVEIDGTAQETREILGLPNVQELQQEWLKRTKAAMMDNPENFAPDKLLANWTKTSAPSFEMMPDVIQAFLKTAMSGSK